MSENPHNSNKFRRKDVDTFKSKDGFKEWYRNGIRHRDDGPAYIDPQGNKWWYQNGDLHREDGPAIESSSGLMWYKNGKLHREDGPAIEYADGSKVWWKNDECLGGDTEGFWKFWALLTEEQKKNKNLLKNLP